MSHSGSGTMRAMRFARRVVFCLGIVPLAGCAHHADQPTWNGHQWTGPRAALAQSASHSVRRAIVALEGDDARTAQRELKSASIYLKDLDEDVRDRILAEGSHGEGLRSALDQYLDRTLRPEICARASRSSVGGDGELGFDDEAPAPRLLAPEAPSRTNCQGRVSAVMFDPLFGADPRFAKQNAELAARGRELAALGREADAREREQAAREREGRVRACDQAVDALLAEGKPRDAKKLARREPCSPEAMRRIDDALVAAAGRDQEACRQTVERLLAAGRAQDAYGHVKVNPGRCAPETVEQASRENGVQRCDAAFAKVEAADAQHPDAAALAEMRAFGKYCPEKLQRAEAMVDDQLKALVAKDPCVLANGQVGTVRPACREHLEKAMRARRWDDAKADLDRVLGTKEAVLPLVVAALRATPPKAPIPGLPTLRAAELALEAHTLRAASPWTAALAGFLAAKAGYPWPLPTPAFEYVQAQRVRTQPVDVIFTQGTQAGTRSAWLIGGQVSVVDEIVHVDAEAFDTYTPVTVGTSTYMSKGVARVAAHDKATGKRYAVVTGVTFVGGAGYSKITVPVQKSEQKRVKREGYYYESEPGERRDDVVRAAAQKAWPSVRERWLEERKRASLEAMRRAPSDEARVEAAVQALLAGSQDPAALAAIEKRFGPLPSGVEVPY